MSDTLSAPLRETPLAALHRARGGRLVPFAGWSLPVQFPAGIIAEVQHCRSRAALFDVSHLGQIELHGPVDAVAAALERLVPGDLRELAQFRQRYTQFLTETGGILDDLIVGCLPDRLRLVVNASRRDHDLAHLRAQLPAAVEVVARPDLALLALQGPLAAIVLERHAPGISALRFMGLAELAIGGIPALIARCGYTGEDGFEISLPADHAAEFAAALLDDPDVAPAGLGARDALRLEAGLCLYGQDIDETTSPVEANLRWSIGRRRRREGGFAGDAAIAGQLARGPERLLIGLRPEGRAPARSGAGIFSDSQVGQVTSGVFSPTLNAPIAMGYVRPDLARPGTRLSVNLRDRHLPALVARMPFVPKTYAARGLS